MKCEDGCIRWMQMFGEEAVMDYFKVLPQHSPRGYEERFISKYDGSLPTKIRTKYSWETN